MKKVLTIAGSDSSGGAGIQADLKTILAHNVYGMSVITAITAQNTLGVTAIENLSLYIIEKQLDAVFQDIYPDAVKIGMVSSPETIKCIAKKIREYKVKNVVLDTVMISTSGHSLLEESAQKELVRELLPLATIITPNIAEAQVLSGIGIKEKSDMVYGAKKIAELTPAHILVKGGHLIDSSDDLLYYNGEEQWFIQNRIPNENTHGTGCTLSSAIACQLAMGMEISQAVKKGKDYLTGALSDGLDLGKGNGPINHGWKI